MPGQRDKPRRRWWQWHSVTWLTVILLFGSVANLNLPLEALTFSVDNGNGYAVSGHSDWHGWPTKFYRLDVQAESEGFRSVKLDVFELAGGVFNSVIAIMLLAATGSATESLAREHTSTLSVTLTGVLTLISSFCTYLVLQAGTLVDRLNEMTYMFTLFCIALSWFGGFRLLGKTVGFMRRRQRETIVP